MAEAKTQYSNITFTLPDLEVHRWLKEEEAQSPFADPLLFLEAYKKGTLQLSEDEAKAFCISECQRVFNAMVRKYFSTPDSWLRISMGEEVARLRHLEKCFDVVLLPNETESFDIHQVMADTYNNLSSLASSRSTKSKVQTVRLGETLSSDTLKEVPESMRGKYKTLVSFQKEVESLGEYGVKSAVLEGSFGSKDPLPLWSDLDCLLLLDDSVFANKEALYKLREHIRRLVYVCYKVDPLAHHAFLFLTELDLKRNVPALFPAPLLSHGMHLTGARSIEAKTQSNTFQSMQTLFRPVQYFRRKVLGKSFSKTAYAWKADLAHLFIMPSFALQAMGIMVYKRESFERLAGEFPILDMSIVKEASCLRENWESTNPLTYYPDAVLFNAPEFLNRAIVSLARRPLLNMPPSLSAQEVEEHTKRMHLFCEAVYAYVKQQYHEAQSH